MDTKNPEQIETKYGKMRRRKIGLISVLTTIAVIAAILLFNYFLDYLSNRYVLEIDMTNNSLYQISDETAQTLRNLSEPVTIYVMCPETTYEGDTKLNQIHEVLKRYEILSEGNVTVTYIDPNSNPQLYNKYNSLGDMSTGDLIVESSKRYKHLQPSNLYELKTDSSSSSSSSSSSDSDSDKTYITGLRAEQSLTSAILYCVADKVPKAAFITDHDENTDLEEFKTLLTNANYDTEDLSLLSGEAIPDDVSMVIISEPKADYTDDEINLLDDFLTNRGGKCIVSYASNTGDLPNLERYFQEWGVSVDSQVVFDNSQCLAGYPYYVIPTLTSVDGLTDNLAKNMYAAIPYPRAMTTLFDNDDQRGTQVLMTSSNSSYAKSLDETVDSVEKADSDEVGPFNLMVMAYQNVVDSALNSTNSYVLFTNAGFISDTSLKTDSLLNSKYLVAALNYITKDEDAVIVDTKEYTSTTMTVQGWQTRVLFWLLIIIIPVGTLGAGLTVWIRRRHM